MSLGIRSKLFLTILLALVLVVVGTLGFVHWSIQRGFVELVEKRELARVERISQRLLRHYRRHGDWQAITNDRGLWVAILNGQRVDQLDRRLRRLLRQMDQSHQSHPDQWPPEAVLKRFKNKDRPPPLELRVLLVDADDVLLIGRKDLLANTRRYPLIEDGESIGSLAVIPDARISEQRDIRFLERQSSGLIFIALGAVVLAALLAVFLARRLADPVRALRASAHALAGGRYAHRIESDKHDELGHLAQDLNTLAATLEQNEQARRQWVADIAHELRTPLGVLRGELEALQDGVRELDASAVDSLHSDALRLSRLVDDLYELSMTDLGALSYRKLACNPLETLEDEVARFRPRFSEHGLALDLHFPSDLALTMQADEQRLSQLFSNLLRNSLRYTDPGGKVLVSALLEDDWLHIDIQDTTPSVPEEALPRLFERLYRVDASRARATGGAGLGLAIAKNITEAHSGHIDARPSPLGGLWVRISLPIQTT